jgi:hypothetical protein
VSCVGTFCAAVGGDSAGALTAVGVGTDWRIVPNPASGEGEGAVLNAVSCVSYRWCLTAGVGIGASLLERWNGTTWSAHPPPVSGVLYALDCLDANECVGAGSDLRSSLVAEWNGRSWRTTVLARSRQLSQLALIAHETR